MATLTISCLSIVRRLLFYDVQIIGIKNNQSEKINQAQDKMRTLND